MRVWIGILCGLLLSACQTSATTSITPTEEGSAGLLLISIDGFKPAYLQQYPAPTLQALAAQGTKAVSMQPVFPTKTFTNHYSIVTGLYPEKHGIVENTIYDAGFGAVFAMKKSGGRPQQPLVVRGADLGYCGKTASKNGHFFLPRL